VSFAWPVALWGLLLVPLALAAYVVVQRRRARYALRFTNLDLLANLVERAPGWRRHVPPVLALLALSALLLGVARPQATVSVPREQATVVLAMDTSGSMTATDVAPNRLRAAQTAAQGFVDRLPKRFRVGVVAFSSQAQVLLPPTTDRAAAGATLASLGAEGGTALGDAIARSAEVGQASGDDEGAPRAVLLLSDGTNTEGRLEPLEAAAEASDLGVRVYTIALGTPEGTVEALDENGVRRTVAVPPDPDTLRRVAAQTGAQFFEAPDEEELAAVYERLGSQVTSVPEEREITAAFAAGGAVLLALGAGLSALWFNRIP
jgi:Ca-activated chloride channel family protein